MPSLLKASTPLHGLEVNVRFDPGEIRSMPSLPRAHIHSMFRATEAPGRLYYALALDRPSSIPIGPSRPLRSRSRIKVEMLLVQLRSGHLAPEELEGRELPVSYSFSMEQLLLQTRPYLDQVDVIILGFRDSSAANREQIDWEKDLVSLGPGLLTNPAK